MHFLVHASQTLVFDTKFRLTSLVDSGIQPGQKTFNICMFIVCNMQMPRFVYFRLSRQYNYAVIVFVFRVDVAVVCVRTH